MIKKWFKIFLLYLFICGIFVGGILGANNDLMGIPFTVCGIVCGAYGLKI